MVGLLRKEILSIHLLRDMFGAVNIISLSLCVFVIIEVIFFLLHVSVAYLLHG